MILLGWEIVSEVLRSLLHLFVSTVATIMEYLRLLNEALLAMSHLHRLLVLLRASLRIHGVELWCRSVLHPHWYCGVLGGHFRVLRLWLRLLRLLHAGHGLMLRLPLRFLLFLILLAVWGHAWAIGERLLLVHVDESMSRTLRKWSGIVWEKEGNGSRSGTSVIH